VKIFAYWDNPGSMPVYLQLCVASWQKCGGIDEVCLISDANVRDWIAEDALDWNALQAYPVPQRKDAIEVAVLARYGGLFLDVDTLCAAPPLAIRQALVNREIALYGFHLAVVAARPSSGVVARWLELLQQTLAVPRARQMEATGLDYTMLGNYTFELLRDELATGRTAIPGEIQGGIVKQWRKLQRYRMLNGSGQTAIAQLDPRISGFIAERDYYSGSKLTARSRYEDFWFDKSVPLSAVTCHGAALTALHHSWTPAAYSALSLSVLAEDQSLLSRYLRALLGGLNEVNLGLTSNAQNPVT